MKRLWACLAILGVLALAATGHIWWLDRFVQEQTALLFQVQEGLGRGDWDRAAQLTDQAQQSWQEQGFLLHITLRHTEVDAVGNSYCELIAFLDAREDLAECSAVNARLMHQLELLLEAELPTLKNLL